VEAALTSVRVAAVEKAEEMICDLGPRLLALFSKSVQVGMETLRWAVV
jgi:hypothetical protein